MRRIFLALFILASAVALGPSFAPHPAQSQFFFVTGTPTPTPTPTPGPTYIPNTPFPSANPTIQAANATECIGGETYGIDSTHGLDDEFQSDNVLFLNPSPIPTAGFTSPPTGTQVTKPQFIWSTQLYNIGRTNNAGVDDAYYTDAHQPYFSGFNPFTLQSGTNPHLQLQAEPAPTPYNAILSADGTLRHYISGVLQSPALTYGYVEVSATEPNLQGFWPAPLWLIYSNGNTAPYPQMQEMDVNELFGNSIGTSVVQQTAIYHYASQPLPQSYSTRATVSPDPGTNYHTYSILWQPAGLCAVSSSTGCVTFYIDRVVQSQYEATSSGAMNANIILQVFASGAFAPAPATPSTQNIDMQYFRWFQDKGTTCGTQTIPTATPSPTATPVPPSPSPAATNLVIVAQSTPDAIGTGFGSLPAQLPATAPSAIPSGDLLLAVGSLLGQNPPIGTGGVASGWTVLEGAGSALMIAYGTVGVNGLSGSGPWQISNGAYGNGSVIHLFAISGATQTPRIINPNTDCGANLTTLTPSLSIPSRGGITLIADAGGQGNNPITSITDSFPPFFTATQQDQTLNNLPIGGTSYAYLQITKMNQETADAAQPFTDTQTLTNGGYQPNTCAQIIYLR